MIMKKKHYVAFFRPIIEESCYSAKDKSYFMLCSYFINISLKYYVEAFCFTKSKLYFFTIIGGKNIIYDKIFTKT